VTKSAFSRTFLNQAPAALQPALLPAVLHLSGAARTTRTKPVSLRCNPASPCFGRQFASRNGSGLKINIRRITMTNIVILVGRVTRDPESRETNSGTTVTNLSVVTDRPARNSEGKTYKDDKGFTVKDAEFHRITCFNGLGKNVAQYCTKGQMVSIEGRLHYTQWEDADKIKRYGCEILADKVDFLTRGASQDNKDAPDIDE
jgi:single-strand DNA-binding protein